MPNFGAMEAIMALPLLVEDMYSFTEEILIYFLKRMTFSVALSHVLFKRSTLGL